MERVNAEQHGTSEEAKKSFLFKFQECCSGDNGWMAAVWRVKQNTPVSNSIELMCHTKYGYSHNLDAAAIAQLALLLHEGQPRLEGQTIANKEPLPAANLSFLDKKKEMKD